MDLHEENTTCTFLPVAEILGSNKAVLYTHGLFFCRAIDEALDQKRQVAISFKDLEVVSFPFLNACLGFIYYKYDSELIKKLLYLPVTTPRIDQHLKGIIWRATNPEVHFRILESEDCDEELMEYLVPSINDSTSESIFFSRSEASTA